MWTAEVQIWHTGKSSIVLRIIWFLCFMVSKRRLIYTSKFWKRRSSILKATRWNFQNKTEFLWARKTTPCATSVTQLKCYTRSIIPCGGLPSPNERSSVLEQFALLWRGNFAGLKFKNRLLFLHRHLRGFKWKFLRKKERNFRLPGMDRVWSF